MAGGSSMTGSSALAPGLESVGRSTSSSLGSGPIVIPSDADGGEPTRIHGPGEPKNTSEMSAPDLSAPSLIGAKLGHFEILDCVGVGGMGRVFRARDVNLERIVAVKILSHEFASDPDISRRFENEAKAAARMDNPHFAKVYHFGREEGLQFIAMEFVEGEDLRKRINRQGRLPYPVVLDIVLQIAYGLSYSEKAGLVHRDIKPSNILVTAEGLAKLVDMGLARSSLQQTEMASELTRVGVTLGTFDYISPEQARNARDADIRSDIYSLGCTMYHAISGRPPFPDGTALQKLLQHQADQAPDPRLQAPEIPQPLVDCLLKMMAKDPNQRYQTARQLIDDLVRLCQLLKTPLPAESRPIEVAEKTSFWRENVGWLVPSGLLSLALLVFSLRPAGEDFEMRRLRDELARPKPTVSRSTPDVSTGRRIELAPTATIESKSTSVISVPENDDLLQRLREAPAGAQLSLQGKQYRLTGSLVGNALISLDRKVTVTGANPAEMTTIFLSIDGASADESRWFGFLTRDEAVFERIRFIVASEKRPVTAITQAGRRLTLRDCHIQLKAASSATEPTIGVESNHPQFANLNVERCVFTGSQEAIRVAGADTVVTIENTGFFRHESAIRFLHGRYLGHLSNVTVLAGAGAPIRQSEASNCRLFVESSIFLRSADSAGPWLTVDAGVAKSAKAFSHWLSHSVLQGFDKGIVAAGAEVLATKLEELETIGFSERRNLARADVDGAIVESFAETAPELESGPALRFRLNEVGRALRTTRDGLFAGVLRGPVSEIYSAEQLKPIIQDRTTPKKTNEGTPAASDSEPNVLSVNPQAKPKGRLGEYRSLATALAEAETGFIIELNTDDTLRISDLRIDGKELTLRAGRDRRPRLRLGSENAREPATRMFSLGPKAKLKIQSIPLDIASSASTATVFDLASDSNIELDGVLVSRAEGSPEFVLFRPRSMARAMPMMNMPANPAAVEQLTLSLNRCQILSRNAILQADPQSYWELRITDSFVASDAPTIQIEGVSMVRGDNRLSSRLICQRSSFSLRDAFVAFVVEGDRPEPTRQLTVRSDGNVFLGAGTAPLVRSTGNLAAAAQANTLQWEGANNFLVGYATLFRYGPTGDTGTMPAEAVMLQKDAWLRRYDLMDDNYYFGSGQENSDARLAVWEQKAPKRDELRSLGLPADAMGAFGADPSLLPVSPPTAPTPTSTGSQ